MPHEDLPASPVPAGNSPEVTVVAIFLNGIRWLQEAIDSVLAQSMQDFELILVDDGSTDGSTELALDYRDRFPGRVIYCDHPGHENLGMSASRNAGAARARGNFIALIDADDIWLPDKLAGQLAAFARFPDAGMVADGATYWKSWEGGTDEDVVPGHVQDELVVPPDASLRTYPLGKGQAPCPSAIMVRAQAWRETGGFEPTFRGIYHMYEDQAFLSKVYSLQPVVFRSTCSIKYRQHDDSCMSVSRNAGNYHKVRAFYMSWFIGWLNQHHAGAPKLRMRIALVSWRYRYPHATLQILKFTRPLRLALRRLHKS